MDVSNLSFHGATHATAPERQGIEEVAEGRQLLAPGDEPRQAEASTGTPDEIEAALHNLPSAKRHGELQNVYAPNDVFKGLKAKHAIDEYKTQFNQPQVEERRNLSAILGIDFYV